MKITLHTLDLVSPQKLLKAWFPAGGPFRRWWNVKSGNL